jgi:hypothetical protein
MPILNHSKKSARCSPGARRSCIVVIVSAFRKNTWDRIPPGCKVFRVSYTLQRCWQNLLCIVIVCIWVKKEGWREKKEKCQTLWRPIWTSFVSTPGDVCGRVVVDVEAEVGDAVQRVLGGVDLGSILQISFGRSLQVKQNQSGWTESSQVWLFTT